MLFHKKAYVKPNWHHDCNAHVDGDHIGSVYFGKGHKAEDHNIASNTDESNEGMLNSYHGNVEASMILNIGLAHQHYDCNRGEIECYKLSGEVEALLNLAPGQVALKWSD